MKQPRPRPSGDAPEPRRGPYTVVDLFSGAGGMSLGFHRHPKFRLIAAADAEFGKPSMKGGSLGCNPAYTRNMGLSPAKLDLSRVEPADLRDALGIGTQAVDVLAVCPPCTGFSRANPQNHLADDRRNSLVQRAAQFATALRAQVVVMENARELIRGNFSAHYGEFCRHLEAHDYQIHGQSCLLSRYGLPQVRERAIVIAVRRPLPLQTLDTLWAGWRVRPEWITVRRALADIPASATEQESFPGFADPRVLSRLQAIPADGGSWADLISRRDAAALLTDSMKRIIAQGRLGSHPDVYGRMAWDRPAPTIKRECAHVGNGRYAHPVAHRLCSLREMARLQGFPDDYLFEGASLSNHYRHLGDAVPPLISWQLAQVCAWILTGRRPPMKSCLLPGTHLSAAALERTD